MSESSTARIGFSEDSDVVASGNMIQGNGFGLAVMNSSNARLVGNTISNNTGDGVLVLRKSSSDLSNNAIDNNGGDGVYVAENSTVQLGANSGTSIFELPNTTSSNNGGFGVACAHGGMVDGRQGTLSGAAGSTSFGSTCINDLLP